MKRAFFETWLQGYTSAWTNNDPEEVATIFTKDANYYTQVFLELWAGRQAIVEGWIGRDDQLR
jgi:uncharacterized protein (TIGR02246 family)